MIPCPAKHAKYQPTDEDWLCPKCGADNRYFVIIAPIDDASEACVLVHEDDEIDCEKCGYGGSGSTVTKKMAAQMNMVKCPHCSGRGYVKGDTP